MNRMVYVIPEMLGIAIIDFLLGLVTVAVISGCFCNVQHKHNKIDKNVHKVLQWTTILEPVSKDSDDEPQSELHGVRVSRKFIYCLVLYIAWLLFGAAIVFLDIFLIDITNSCDPSVSKANCFLNAGFFNISALYDEPIDCNNLDDLPDNVTFICYRYTLDLGGAFGAAIGLFATGMMFMKLIALCCVSKEPSKYCKIIMIVHMCLGIILSSLVLVSILAVPQSRQILTEESLIVKFRFVHILISLIIVHALFILTVYNKETNNNHTNKKACDYETGTENTPGATQSTDTPITTLPHEQSTEPQEEPSVSVQSTKSQSAGMHD